MFYCKSTFFSTSFSVEHTAIYKRCNRYARPIHSDRNIAERRQIVGLVSHDAVQLEVQLEETQNGFCVGKPLNLHLIIHIQLYKGSRLA